MNSKIARNPGEPGRGSLSTTDAALQEMKLQLSRMCVLICPSCLQCFHAVCVVNHDLMPRFITARAQLWTCGGSHSYKDYGVICSETDTLARIGGEMRGLRGEDEGAIDGYLPR